MRTLDWLYELLVEMLDEGHGNGGRTWVHCDQLTLHRFGECETCDEYGEKAQRSRVTRGIPFSGDPGAPDAIFRSDEKIKRWGGNRPVTGSEEPRAIQTEQIFTADNLEVSQPFRVVGGEMATLSWTFPLPDGRKFLAKIVGEVLP